MTRVSATENGVDIVHAAISGKSALITADGSIEGMSNLFSAEILTGEVRWRTAGRTLYTRVGDWLQVLAMIATIFVFFPLRDRDTGDLVFSRRRAAHRF